MLAGQNKRTGGPDLARSSPMSDLRRQNMNSKLGEEQKKKKKKGHHARRSPNFDPNSDKNQKKGQNDNGLILGRVSINTRNRPSNALLLGRVLGLDTSLFQECRNSKPETVL